MRTGFAQQHVQQETLAILAVLLAALLAVTAATADPGWQELQHVIAWHEASHAQLPQQYQEEAKGLQDGPPTQTTAAAYEEKPG